VPLRLFYVDDSGSVVTGYVVYSWIECDAAQWRSGLAAWLGLRRELYNRYRIPPAYELHATAFLNGRGNPSTDEAWNRSKQARWEAAELMLAAIAACPELSVGTVYRHTAARGHAYHEHRVGLYDRLVGHLDTRLAADGELGMLLMDGDGTATGYYAAHRALKLSRRSLIEDPLFQASHRSQWVQIADLAAYVAFQSLLRYPGKEFCWDWYERYLRPCDRNGGPLAL
jgi:mannose/cellobiose epimerase-like protein (N-acyl-D-glucosamine 2-epimerase family)